MARINDLAGAFADDATADAAFVAAGWAKSDGVQYYDTTLEIIKRWSEALGEWTTGAMPARWEDLRIASFAPRGSAPSLAAYSTTPVGAELEAWAFANNSTSRGLDGFSQWPHAALPGANGYLHLHIATTNAVEANTDVGLFCSLLVQKIDDPIASAYTRLLWLSRKAPAGGWAAKTHIMTESFEVPAAQLERSAMIMVDVFRHKGTEYTTDNAGAVTESIDDVIWLFELDLHYQAVRFGTELPT